MIAATSDLDPVSSSTAEHSSASAVEASSSNDLSRQDELAFQLLQRVALLTRITFTRSDIALHRNDASLMSRLEAGPQRISTLCELEALAQPTVTIAVKRLIEAGLLKRESDPTDGRAVLISMTAAGRETLAQARAGYTSLLSAHIAKLSDEQRRTLMKANDALAELINQLERDTAPTRGASRLQDQTK